MLRKLVLITCLASPIGIFAQAEGGATGERLNYNWQVRPVLAKTCFSCHGPDESHRKGKLRLDVAEEAYAKGAWNPGKPDESEGIKRLFSTDKDEVMPPPDATHALELGDRDLLKRWVAEGAVYEKHWAFVPPVKPPVPKYVASFEPSNKDLNNAQKSPSALKKLNEKIKKEGKKEHTARKKGFEMAPPHFPIRSEIDAFVLDKMMDADLEPTGKTSREQWLRRVTFALTGLPPTLQEIDAFLADQTNECYDKVVDRLLESKAFGERMATDWLDSARYADSYGRHEDAESMVWPYRDWVVSAFNKNLPYDQFLTWQTAGDLLPNSTQEQRLATVFNRLVNQSNEAGSNEEEFRQELVADRVKTNATAILGLTMECARCHDHKYDPISMKEYYSFAAFLNNIDELGLYCESTAGISAPSMYLMKDQEQKSHDALVAKIAEAEKHLQEVDVGAKSRFQTWTAANGNPPLADPTDTISFERVAKKGEKHSKRDIFNAARPSDPPNSFKYLAEFTDGLQGQGAIIGGGNLLAIKGRGEFRRSDQFSFSLWIKPTQEQEKAVLLHRSVAGLEAASRGYEIILKGMHVEFSLSHVAPGNSIRIRSPFPISINKWNHLVATYDGSSRAEGLKLYINEKLIDCEVISNHLYKDITYRAEWGDYDASKVQDNTRAAVDLTLGGRYNDMGPKEMVFDEINVFPLVLTPAEVVHLHCGETPKDEASEFARYLRDHDEEFKAAVKNLHAARTAEDDFVSKSTEIMVMKERDKPRETTVQLRGRFDQPGEKVSPITPKSIWEMPVEYPRNRLGLAQWYVDKRNPLTARVAVNRYWQLFFGRGIVSTQEDFGLQGQLPTHPELLDWLAVDFVEHGWDVKRLCREIALSSTYRQNSQPDDKESYEIDPQNALLSRGPKVRLQAEMLRDLALRAADLLNPEMGGKPVKTYQPDNLYHDSGVQVDYNQDHGNVLWKRSVYLFRKRTLPLPFLTVFDASTREFCRVRRESTATPLQALALLNAPDFLEPCRVLAEKSLERNPADLKLVINESFRRFTGRRPAEAELTILRKVYDEQLEYYNARQHQAAELLEHSGETPVNKELPAPKVAALTMVHRLILSDDDSIMSK